jgi:hypothetical protein
LATEQGKSSQEPASEGGGSPLSPQSVTSKVPVGHGAQEDVAVPPQLETQRTMLVQGVGVLVGGGGVLPQSQSAKATDKTIIKMITRQS